MRNIVIDIRPIQLDDYQAFNAAVNSVCDEKMYVATVTGFDLRQTEKYVENVVKNNYPLVVADENGILIGWCGIIPDSRAGFSHVGTLGMGIIKPFRGKGIGKKLLNSCLNWAKTTAIEKVELEVFSDNEIAKGLYVAVGFKQEGFKVNARKYQERYQDIITMALFFKL